ncbi:MAG: hypothetical protein J6M18_06015 [Actinomycetaceae bacterium]|nr:hypothetical protein [Actinomycetaceae bacterium]
MSLLGLTGCSSHEEPLPQPTNIEQNIVAPVLNNEQVDGVMGKIFDTISTADEQLNVDTLKTRLSGPALQKRLLEYKKKSAMGDGYSLSPLAKTFKASAISGSQYESGRITYMVMEPAGDEKFVRLDVFKQNDVRSNWTLWASFTPLPGTIPGVKNEYKKGAEVIDANSNDGLLASPNDVVNGYLNVLKNGKSPENLAFVEDDYFHKNLSERYGREISSPMKDVGNANITYAMGSDGATALRTDDGGALVFAPLTYMSEMNITKNGASTTLKGEDISIVATGKKDGEVKFTQFMKIEYSAALCLYVPPADAKDAQVRLVAYVDGTPVKVEAK